MRKNESFAVNTVVSILYNMGTLTAENIQKIIELMTGKESEKVPALLKQKDIARHCSVCRQTVRSWEASGKLKPVTLPDGQKRYRLQDIIKEEDA